MLLSLAPSCPNMRPLVFANEARRGQFSAVDGPLPVSYPFKGLGYTLDECPILWDRFSWLRTDRSRLRTFLRPSQHLKHRSWSPLADIGLGSPGERPPKKWSAPMFRKAEDYRWPLRDPSPKRLS